MDKLQAMQTFVAVVESGSFVAAVDVTGQSKPAVSRQVSELEQFLGIRLLHRTTRRLSLTDEGRVYFARCKELLETIQDVESEVGLNSDQACGRLRIGAPQDFGVEQLAPLWGKFTEQHPLITLNITLSDRTIDLLEEGFDMAIRISALGDSRMVARPLAPVRMIACAAPDFLARHGTPGTPAELRDYPFISYSYRAGGDDWSFRHVHGDTCQVRVRSTVYVNNGATCRAMAIAGQGIAIQPDFIVNAAIQAGQLVELFEGWSTGEQLVVHTLYPTRTHLPPKVQRMRDFLIEQFRAPPWRPRPQDGAA